VTSGSPEVKLAPIPDSPDGCRSLRAEAAALRRNLSGREAVMPEQRRTSLLVLMGLAPCLAAFAAEAIPVHAVSLPEPPPLAPLSFDQYAVNYGEIGPYPLVEAHFTFRNRGDQPVAIEEVEPSCGCLKWHLTGDRKIYKPGELGRLTVRLFTANERPGPHEYAVRVQSRGERPAQDELMFRVTLPEKKLSLEPHEVFFYQLTGKPDERIVHLIDYRDSTAEPVEVLEVDCTTDLVRVEQLPPERDERGHRRIPIRLSVEGTVPLGRKIAHLRIRTNDPDFPVIGAPVLVEGGERIYGPPMPEGSDVIWNVIGSRYNSTRQR
jgi:hypothetical protein